MWPPDRSSATLVRMFGGRLPPVMRFQADATNGRIVQEPHWHVIGPALAMAAHLAMNATEVTAAPVLRLYGL